MDEVVALLLKLFQGADVAPRMIFDAGAYKGHFSSALAPHFESAEYHLFEPQPEFANALQQALSEGSKFSVNGCALDRFDGVRSFYLGRFAPTSSFYPRHAGRQYFNPEYSLDEQIQVPVRRLDSYSEQHGVSHIDLLKMDTQGAELSVLQGVSGLLAGQQIDVLVSEFFAYPHYAGAPLLPAIWDFLVPFGYHLYQLAALEVASDGQLRYGDAVFISEAARDKLLDSQSKQAGER